MSGVTILETIPSTGFTTVLYWVGVFFLIFGTIAFGLGIICNLRPISLTIGFILYAVGMVVITCTALVSIYQGGAIGDKTYKVMIDDTVTAKEFNNKYEILKIQGETYWVKERENKGED